MKNIGLSLFAMAGYLTVAACDGHTHSHVQSNTILMGQKVATPETGLKASWNETQITLSDGRVFQLKKVAQKDLSSQLIVTAPGDVTVTLEYPDGTNSFTSKAPFVYNVPQVKNNEYFKLTVDEGGPEKTWSVNLQHEINSVLTIEPVLQ